MSKEPDRSATPPGSSSGLQIVAADEAFAIRVGDNNGHAWVKRAGDVLPTLYSEAKARAHSVSERHEIRRLAVIAIDVTDGGTLEALADAHLANERLLWVISNPHIRVTGSDDKGWAVWDCDLGLEEVAAGPTAISAIDAARAKLANR